MYSDGLTRPCNGDVGVTNSGGVLWSLGGGAWFVEFVEADEVDVQVGLVEVKIKVEVGLEVDVKVGLVEVETFKKFFESQWRFSMRLLCKC